MFTFRALLTYDAAEIGDVLVDVFADGADPPERVAIRAAADPQLVDIFHLVPGSRTTRFVMYRYRNSLLAERSAL